LSHLESLGRTQDQGAPLPTIDVDQLTYDKLQITAQLTEKPIGAVVKQLLDRLAAPPPITASSASGAASGPALSDAAWVPVFKVYKGHRIEGEFNPMSMELKVTTAPWSRRVFNSPTAAAIAVVEHFPSARETSNTNGRKFWKVAATGNDLRSLVGER
jgi:hypothetical protein